MEKSAARKSAKSQRSHGGGYLRRRSRHPSPPDHENNLFGDGDDGEKESLSTASDVRDQATKLASEESEPVGLRTRSKLVMDGGDVERKPDDSDANEDEAELDPASRHNFTEARDSEWQWHQLGHMQVCTSLQTNNHVSTPPLSFFTNRMPFLPPNQQRQNTAGNRPKHKRE